MLRTCLFLILASVAGAAAAQTQVTDDPQAVAPVQYDNGDNGSATMMDCGMDNYGRPLPCQNNSQYVADDQMDEPDVDSAFAPDYYAYQNYEYYPPFYAGVSLWPYGYGYWPGFACCGWGFGWPVYGFGIDFGFGRHHGWDHGFAGHDHFHGPWRYDGHGHYWDNHAAFARNDRSFNGRSFNGRDNRNFAGDSRANFGTNRSMSDQRGFSRGGNNGQTAFRSNDARSASFGANRAPLRSSSYYSASRGGSNPQAFDHGNFNSNVRGNAVQSNSRATGAGLNANPHVASMPNRGYASQTYRSTNVPNRTYTGTQRGGSMGTQQRYYGSMSRGGNYTNYSGGRSPSYGGGRSASYGHPTYSGRSSSSASHAESRSSGGSHSSGGHESGGHDSGGHNH